MEDNKFNFFVEATIEKAGKKDKDGYPEELIISGVASTSDEDTDGETLEPNGYLLDRFVKSGFLNFEHRAKDDPKFIVGEPIDSYIKDNKMFIKGRLYKSKPLARSIYDSIRTLGDEGSDRKVGFSIEGKALKRDPFNPKRITKALITNCAITFNAKNQNTWATISKGQQTEDFVDYEPNGGQVYLLDVTRGDGTRITVDLDFNVKIDKAMSTASGAALIKESLNGKIKKLQPEILKSIMIISESLNSGQIDRRFKSIITEKIRKFVA